MTILIPYQVDFRKRKITRDKEGHYIMTKVNPPRRHNNSKYVSNNKALKYRKQKLIELGENSK